MDDPFSLGDYWRDSVENEDLPDLASHNGISKQNDEPLPWEVYENFHYLKLAELKRHLTVKHRVDLTHSLSDTY